MADSSIDDVLATYLAQPVSGDRTQATFQLSPRLLDVLTQLAAERHVTVDVFVEYALFKQLRSEQARRLVGERPDAIPTSFLNEQVARAKVEVAKDVAAIRNVEGRGDRAERIANQLEQILADATGKSGSGSSDI
jgi:hypothetical protein